ncbi:MAG: hypothetical protein AAF572_25775 [Cyanobacteria bacterium P01_B01_bin.77]
MYTDEYGIYNSLEEWGVDHKSVCHSAGEYARDDDGDGFHEVPLRASSGHCYAPGYGLTEGFSRTSSCVSGLL